jgi:hypothetical protein
MRKRWKLIIGGLGLFLAFCIYQIAVYTPYPVKTLPDGATVGLVGVTYQKSQSTRVGSIWDGVMGTLFPDVRPGRRSIELLAGSAPTVWLHFSRQYWHRSSEMPVVVLRSKAGDEWWMDGDSNRGDMVNRREGLVGATFPTFPRRDRNLTLRVYQRTGGMFTLGVERWVDFHLLNPAFRNYPVWTPEPFPIVRRSSDLKIELTSLRTGVEFPTGAISAWSPHHAATFATFRITRNGSPARDWEPVELTYTDSTGNRLNAVEDRITRSGDTIGFPIYGQLPSDESAWNVQAEFSRFRSRPVNPEQSWFVRRIPVTDRHTSSAWRAMRLAPGVTLHLQLTAEPSAGKRVLSLRLEVAGKWKLRFRFRGETNTGSLLGGDDMMWSPTQGQGLPEWSVVIPPATQSVDLAVSAYESRTVQFYARPTRVN